MVKAILLTALAVLFAGGMATAQTGAEIVVVSVNGTARFETSQGRFEALRVNQKITATTVINTGINSSVVLRVGEETITIRAMQRGTVANLIASETSAKSGITLGAAIAENPEFTGQSRTNISTAATRASDATEDITWAEEVTE